MGKTLHPMSSVVGDEGEMGIDTMLGEKKGTVCDVEDMQRMGKQQVFKVRRLETNLLEGI